MIKDNKLVEKAMNEYYDLKEEIERKKLDLWKLKEELNSIINQEPYMSGRLKSRQHIIYKLEGQIKALERKMNEIKKNAHLKDSVEILKLSGFPVNDACIKDYNFEDPKVIEAVIKKLEKEAKEGKFVDPNYLAGVKRALEKAKRERAKDACKVFTKGEAEDDDATENGSIEEFGKNKEIEKWI